MGSAVFDEQAAVRAARGGDRTAFGTLVQEYGRRAYSAAYGYVHNREDALDLAQESFARAFRAMGRFDIDMPFYPWLYRIIRNTCLNHLKKKQRHGETSLNGLMESGFDAEDASQTPREAGQAEDDKRLIRQAMARLSPDHQEILRLRHLLEFSYTEIAAQLGIPQGTVMSRLHAARNALRRALEETQTANETPGGGV